MVVISDDVLQSLLVEPAPPFTGYAGAIVRIALKNFMTYHKAELSPGPHINLILGPNGTGKSTIVNAICLGLNGASKILGRANTLKSFIRRNTNSGYIEIELFNPDGENYVVRRVFKVAGAGAAVSEWYLNQQSVGTSKIEDLLTKLNIQLDNLCQFLPQDRIQEFTKLDPFTLLQSTEKAIGNDTLFNQHENLIKLTTKMETVEHQLKMSTKSLNTEMQHAKNLENDVQRFEQRERVNERIKELNAYKVWIRFLQELEVFSNVQNECKKIEQEKAEAETSIKPMKNTVTFLEDKLSKLKVEMNKTRSLNWAAMNTIKRQYEAELDKVSSEVGDLQCNLESQETQEKERVNRLKNAQQKVKAVIDELAQAKQREDLDEEAMQNKIKAIEHSNLDINNQIFEEKSRERQDEMEKNDLLRSLQSVKGELRQFDHWKSSRMRILQRINHNVYQAVQHFQNPDNLVRLKGKLYDPMILELTVKDIKWGKILEKHIPMNHMLALLCEHHEDVAVVSDILNSLNIRASVVHHDPAGHGVPKSKYSKDMLRRFKFDRVLVECVEADVYYLTYICKLFNCHNVPVGTPETDKLTQQISNHTDLRTYYTETWSYRFKTSNYSGHKSSFTSHLPPARIFTDQINVAEKKELIEREKNLKKMVDGLDRKIKSRAPNLNSLIQQRNQEEAKIKELRGRIQYFRNLEGKIELANKTVSYYERNKIDIPALREETRKKVNALNVTTHRAMIKATKDSATVSMKNIRLLVLKRQIAASQSYIINCQNQMEDVVNMITRYTNQIKLLQDEVKNTAHVAERYKADAHAVCDKPPQPVVDKLVNPTEIEKELRLMNVQLGLLGADTDPNVVKNYNARVKQIEELTRLKESQELDLANMKKELANSEDKWLNPLHNLIKRISKNFGRFFSIMNCAGEVVLDFPDNLTQFSKYGVKIRVQFRSADKMTDLTGFKHSGGERAISTALYVLSLQELTSVPFRVIDEINQGMDAKNEALFFRFLSQLAEGPDSPQYFLLTPKPLPTTDFGDNIDFFVILNGPYVDVPCREDTFKKHSKSDRRKLESSKRKHD